MLQMPFEIDLAKKTGDQRRFIICRCTAEDADAYLRLQEEVYAGLEDPGFFILVGREDFCDYAANDVCLFAYCGGDLAGATILVTNRIVHGNMGYHLNYSEEQLLRTASLDTTVVAPAYRGYGLQKLFVELREAAARDRGATEMLVTVAPDNEFSCKNLLASGYEIIGRRNLYNNMDRYILRKEL